MRDYSIFPRRLKIKTGGPKMSDKFRKLSPEELSTYGVKVSSAQHDFIKSVKSCFGANAVRALVGFNSEYNDSGYDLRGFSYIEVYDKNENMMTPLKNKITEWRTTLSGDMAYSLLGKASSELYESPADMVIYLEIPELYVKV